jgi:hypothetical protein
VSAGNWKVTVAPACAGSQVVSARQPRRVYSWVEGVLELIARRAGTLRVGIREHGTGRYVWCSLLTDEWLADIPCEAFPPAAEKHKFRDVRQK